MCLKRICNCYSVDELNILFFILKSDGRKKKYINILFKMNKWLYYFLIISLPLNYIIRGISMIVKRYLRKKIFGEWKEQIKKFERMGFKRAACVRSPNNMWMERSWWDRRDYYAREVGVSESEYAVWFKGIRRKKGRKDEERTEETSKREWVRY